jgi:MoxR-like ATPase
VVGAAAVVERSNGSIGSARIGLTNMGSTPVRATAAESALSGPDPSSVAEATSSATRARAPPRTSRPRPSTADTWRACSAGELSRRPSPVERARGERRGALPPGVSHFRELGERLREEDYLADEGLSTAIFLALKLGRPLFLEGEAGVGKTEVAKVLSRILETPLIRLQCYEGIDVYQAVYEWDYARQLLHIRAAEAFGGEDRERVERDLYDREFLVSRPLLQALEHRGRMPPVLLIDEVDRSDDEFEAFLLEILSDFAVTIPELGTVRAQRPPVAVLTSNRTREVHDALKRRCLYHYIEHPSFEREVEIVRLRVPDAEEGLARQVAAATEKMRAMDLYKPPGVAETLDWTEALVALGTRELNEQLVEATLGSVLKYREDQQRAANADLARLVSRVGGAAG